MKKKTLLALPVLVLLFGLVAWSPTPSTDDVVVGSTTITSPSGQIVVVGTESSGKAKSGLVVGVGHFVSTDPDDGTRSGTIVTGDENTVDATSTLVSGWSNTVNSVTTTETRNSCVIGGNNQVLAVHGYALGYLNTISADYGHAYGHGLEVANAPKSIALGRYNALMAADDVLVVGTGDSVTERNTSLRATSEGSLILGSATSGTVVLAKSQGDISMGDYAN